MKCTLWDKTTDIHLILETLDISNISLYDAYEKYCKMQRKENKMIVTKYFFEKFVFDFLETHNITNINS
jgi:UTP-glucose-1-phosphate uridylyltransferase